MKRIIVKESDDESYPIYIPEEDEFLCDCDLIIKQSEAYYCEVCQKYLCEDCYREGHTQHIE